MHKRRRGTPRTGWVGPRARSVGAILGMGGRAAGPRVLRPPEALRRRRSCDEEYPGHSYRHRPCPRGRRRPGPVLDSPRHGRSGFASGGFPRSRLGRPGAGWSRDGRLGVRNLRGQGWRNACPPRPTAELRGGGLVPIREEPDVLRRPPHPFRRIDLLPLRLDSLVRRGAVACSALLHGAPRGAPTGAAVRRHLSGLQDADASLDSPKATELGDTPGGRRRNPRSRFGRLDGGFGAILALFRASRSWRRAAREMVGWVQRQISSWQIQWTRRALWPPTTPSARSRE